jgi:hypothetical protein
VYAGNDLAVFNLVSPKNIDGEKCTDIASPVKIELWNLGENDYNFTKDNITAGYEIINPRGITYSGNVSINTGKLLSGESKDIELMPVLPVIAGKYTIKAWVKSPIDNFSCDDTLHAVYVSRLIPLPVDEDFSTNKWIETFSSASVIGNDKWSPYTDITNQIPLPDSTDGMLRYVGTYGSMSLLSTIQLDLSEAPDPELKFWYYHDATVSDFDRSYTNVNIIVDEIPNTILRLGIKDTASASGFTGWKQYTVDLKPFIDGV